jgi:hypothetical protein
LIKRKELAVIPNEMIMIDQRAPARSWNVASPSVNMHPMVAQRPASKGRRDGRKSDVTY